MKRRITRPRLRQQGFSILEMLLATVILLVGLVSVAQLVPASLLLNYRNRMDSSALVFAQRRLDQMIDQPLTSSSFLDDLGNNCQLGNPANPNVVQGTNVVNVNNQTLIDFSGSTPSLAPTSGYGFTYQDPKDPAGTTYDVRWAVIITGNGSTAATKRFILGVRQIGGSGFFLPITLETMVSK
ncbi:MAG TPA: prepilin-type N-terminal cleavage/methylation domain-containing protein [Terriglobales bacterium]|nr:prepilin-type N-terminal cleavage/methylation domain-containing protein [Terriglobales bacterium]